MAILSTWNPRAFNTTRKNLSLKSIILLFCTCNISSSAVRLILELVHMKFISLILELVHMQSNATRKNHTLMWRVLGYRHHLSIILPFCTSNVPHEKSSSTVGPISLILELVHIHPKSSNTTRKKSNFDLWILDYRHHLSIILLFCTCNIAHEKSSSGVRPISLVLELVHMQSKSIQYNSKKSQFNVNFRLPGSSVHNSSVLHVQYTTWKVIISGETHFFNSRTCPHEIQEHPIQLKKKKHSMMWTLGYRRH